jgi:hypothetical protein
MASKRKKRKKRRITPSDVLENPIKATALELIRMIHRVNPTGEELDRKETVERYRLKARLQSLLIRRFKEGLHVKPSDDENPQVVSIRLARFGEDACHAVIRELDEDARSWIQRRIDEEIANKSAVENDSAGPAGKRVFLSRELSVSESENGNGNDEDLDRMSRRKLVQLGRQALADYDYESCEKYYRQAFQRSNGSLEEVLCLLELYVDHVAAYEKATALSQSLSTEAIKNQEVKTLLALAAAKGGKIEQALSHIGRTSTPRAMEVYLLASTHFIEHGKEEQAKEMVTLLTASNRPELQPEIEKLTAGIHRLKVNRLVPLEKEMTLAQKKGQKEVVLRLADRILAQWPQNEAARQIRQAFEKEARDKEIKTLLGEADEAGYKEQFQKEAALLKKAIAKGAHSKSLTRRLQQSTHLAKQRKAEAESLKVLDLWHGGEKREALLSYLELGSMQQKQIREKIGDPHYFWLERMRSVHKTVKPEKTVDAVLTLGQSKEALHAGENPHTIISAMDAFAKLLQPITEAKIIRKQAEDRLEAIDRKTAKQHLDKARRCLEAEDLEQTRGAIEKIDKAVLSEADTMFLTQLHGRLQIMEKKKRLHQTYTDSLNRQDQFACREIAGQLAGLDGSSDSSDWLKKAEKHGAAIKKEWAYTEGDLKGLPACYGLLEINWAKKETTCCVLPDGAHILLAGTHRQWLFLRTFSIEQQEFKKGILMHTPTPLTYLSVSVSGSMIWILGGEAQIAGISTDTFDIAAWHDFSEFFSGEPDFGDMLFFPKSRYLWLNNQILSESGEEAYEIINVDQRRVDRRVKSIGVSMVIDKGGEFIIADQNVNSDRVHLFSERGKPLAAYDFGPYALVHSATLHPNGKDYVFLSFTEGEQEEDQLLNICVRPDVEKKYQPVVIKDSDGNLQHGIHTALDDGLLFIQFIDTASTDDIFSTKSSYKLACYKPSAAGFDCLYQVKLKKAVAIATDEFSKKLVALGRRNKQVKAVVLNEHQSEIKPFSDHNPLLAALPVFDHPIFCGQPTGEFYELALSYISEFDDYSLGVDKIVEKIKEKHGDNPHELAACLYGLERSFHKDKAEKFRQWMVQKHPDHPWTVYDQVCDAAKQKRWPRVISLFEKVSPKDFDDGTACHACHILGMAHFIEGDIKSALKTWEEGTTYKEGQCDLEPYLTYARLSLMTAGKRKTCENQSDLHRTLQFYETVSVSISDEDWPAAIALMEDRDILNTDHLQLLAKLADAYLHQSVTRGEMRWFCKVIVLAHYCDRYDDRMIAKTPVLPPYIAVWSEDRIKEVARRAAQWLDHTAQQENIA